MSDKTNWIIYPQQQRTTKNKSDNSFGIILIIGVLLSIIEVPVAIFVGGQFMIGTIICLLIFNFIVLPLVLS
jgi:hypothetical protein